MSTTKKIKLSVLTLFLIIGSVNLRAQEKYTGLNLLINLGNTSSFSVNYEFDVYEQVTVAPFLLIDFDGNFGLGARGRYYFDALFKLDNPWDVYAGLDLGWRFTRNDFQAGFFIGGRWHINEVISVELEFEGGTVFSGASAGIGLKF